MEPSIQAQSYYNKAQENCMSQALSYLQGFSEQEIRDLVRETFKNARENNTSIETAATNANAEITKYLQNKLFRQNDQYNKLFNPQTGLYYRILRKEITINDVLSKNTTKLKGGNIENAQEAVQVNLRQKVFLSLSKPAQLLLMKGGYDRAIGTYIDSGTVPAHLGRELGGYIKEIGDSYKRQVNFLTPYELMNSTAFGISDFNAKRFLRSTYDPAKLAQRNGLLKNVMNFAKGSKVEKISLEDAKRHFVESMMKRADINIMFPTAIDAEEAAEEAFENQFDSIMGSQTINLSAEKAIKDTPEIKKQGRMFVAWKSMGDYLDHQKEFGDGQGSLWEAMNSDIQATGKKAGMAQVLGADESWSFKQLQKAHLEANGNLPKGNNPAHIFAELNGSVNIPYRPYVAQMQSNFNAWTGAVKQTLIAPLTINDTNFGLQMINKLSKNSYFQDMLTKVKFIGKAYAQQLGGEEQEEVKMMANNMYHSMMFDHGAQSRFIGSENMGEMTRKAVSSWFAINGMKGKDFGNRAGAMFLVSKIATDLKGLKFEDLSPDMQTRMKAFNIAPEEWDVWRRNMNSYAGDHNLTGIEDIQNASDADIKSLSVDLNTSEFQARQNLTNKVYGWLQTAADETILTPGAMERAFFNRGTQAGTLWGVAARAIAQFKGFMMSYVNRILINGYTQDSSMMKWRWAMTNFMYTLPATLLGNWMYSLSKGQQVNFNPENWGPEDWTNAFIPPLSLFTKTLDPKNQNSNLMLNMLQSPSIHTLSDVLATGGAGANLLRPSIKHRGTKFGKQVAGLAYDTTPINSVPYLSGWWHKNAM